MLVYVKCVPEFVDNVEHVIASLPVTVKVIVADVEVAADAANVTVGAVVSIVTVFEEAADKLPPASTA
jgi:DNA uptake protein ComE-like DNA-binding protein